MKYYSAKSAVAVFYYLLSVDNKIVQEELRKFDEIGTEIDAANFMSYRNEVIWRCENQKRTTNYARNYFDVISEGVDMELSADISDNENVIASRLLIWDLLVISYSDAEYHPAERRLIEHIVYISEMPTSVFQEMELLIRSAVEVENERNWLSYSARPYNEIAPRIEALNRRIAYITESAKKLIDDEVMTPSIEALKIKTNVFDHVEGAVAPVTNRVRERFEPATSGVSNAVAPVGEKAGEVFESAKAAVSGIASDVGKSLGGFFGFGKKK